MPLYEYQCTECKQESEQMRPVDQRDAVMSCAKCAKGALQRKVSQGTRFDLKGAGFHATDYGKYSRRKWT